MKYDLRAPTAVVLTARLLVSAKSPFARRFRGCARALPHRPISLSISFLRLRPYLIRSRHTSPVALFTVCLHPPGRPRLCDLLTSANLDPNLTDIGHIFANFGPTRPNSPQICSILSAEAMAPSLRRARRPPSASGSKTPAGIVRRGGLRSTHVFDTPIAEDPTHLDPAGPDSRTVSYR